jgi:ubiquinone/menaquinone biosynthesis C-methylase UbiE
MTLECTGERFLPEMGAEISFEHRVRYLFAKEFIKNKKVLDVPSGEGYGSFELSKVAGSVTGIDISKAAVDHATSKYKNNNLNFNISSMACLSAFSDEEFDVITCFEGIEHVSKDIQKLALKEFRRVLKQDGILIISSPNKRVYSDISGYNNPYHLAEYYYSDMKLELENFFQFVQFLGQSNLTSSMLIKEDDPIIQSRLLPSDSSGKALAFDINDSLYFICVCSNSPKEISSLGLLDIKKEMEVEKNKYFQSQIDKTIEQMNSQFQLTLNEIYNSKSWRITLPLRKLRKLFT